MNFNLYDPNYALYTHPYPRNFYPCSCWYGDYTHPQDRDYPIYNNDGEQYPYYPSQVLIPTRQYNVTLQNQGNSPYKNWYLDIDGNTGRVILSENQFSGVFWSLTNHGNGIVTIQNQGNSHYKNWYLDIDGNTGQVILSQNQFSGVFWRVSNHGNGIVTLQNQGNSPYKNWYLDIDGNTGRVILSQNQFSGVFWNLTRST
ncbi:hypothetical protein PM3016_1562 [Paenibacillus mucilaginosus 3016]|uniref:Ricin B lectin domain-containing protein n=1 Tax=Paenibacillus mucilaginosus 3016 TaxID=1116391 RepID=H6N9V7_9BACL|nr:hypothetical protein [Paenibacillus mucilaginosus]AFC28485.1 hypothetical protein PM3016_1562 [Paenibacillus mucilaginosus 3016]WFA17281.1 hypothetical protein ERY13_08250 [Paenibacillus mucilaginosus]